jgi:tRNA pseudouridine38-40 synthase
VQGALEEALGRIAGAPVRVAGAGRTDAGVHALAQVFAFRWPSAHPWQRLPGALSGMLGPEVNISRVEPAPAGFDPRRSAVGKHYAYTLQLGPRLDPLMRRFAWHVPHTLDRDLLAACAARLVGTHDFAAYQGGGGTVEDTVRTIRACAVEPGGVVTVPGADLLRIAFHGDGFLNHMVRNLVGTLVAIARGAEPDSALTDRLARPGPFRGHAAPAHGLALLRVDYEPPWPETEPS